MSDKIYGIVVAFVVAFIAWYFGGIYPIVGGAVFAILLGMSVTYFFPSKTEKIKSGATFTGKRVLQLSVVLLGFQMNIKEVISVGQISLTVMVFTLATAFLSAWFFGKLLKVNSITTILVGVGTAICGGSAIAATAPVVHAKENEIAEAISTIFLFNIIAVFVFPFFGHLFNMSDIGFGIWAGTAVNDTSSVLATGYAYSNEAGTLATIVKLTRTLMIIPITFVLSIYIAKVANKESRFSFSSAFPWFVIGFVLTAIINSSKMLPLELTEYLAFLGKFLIAVAMAAIGLNTDIAKLLRNGQKAILLGLISWINLAVVSLVVQYMMNLL